MSGDQIESIYQLLTEHNFYTNKNVPAEFKCGKCRKILIEACQIQCGCRFCRGCIDEMINNGCKFCPGMTNNCKIRLLSTAQLDFRANFQISKLIMKCPEKMCSYECELLEMSEHLRICGKKSVECPFYKFGCNTKKVTNEKLIEHFQSENYNHSKTLIDMIDNIKNEIGELREKELINHEEINKLKKDLLSKDEKIKLINEEMKMLKIEKSKMEKRLKKVEETQNNDLANLKSKHEKESQSIKTTKEELDDQIQNWLKNIWCKIDEIESELKKRCENNKIESIKSDLIRTMKSLQTKFDEIKSLNNEIKMKEVCKQTIDKSIMQMGIAEKIKQLEENVENKMKGIFEVIIDSVGELKKKDYVIWSEYFHARRHPYKFRLYFISFGDEISIYLYIYDDVMNQYSTFPFKADVTIKIMNKNKREVSKSVNKFCQIEKPENNSFNWSDPFIYSKSELTKNGILELNCFLVQCCVE